MVRPVGRGIVARFHRSRLCKLRPERWVSSTDRWRTVTRDRVSYFLDLLARLRVSSRPEELALVTGGYRAEVERMQREMLDYLTRPADRTARAG